MLIDGDDELEFDVRGWIYGTEFDDDWLFVDVVWTIVDDALRTLDVLNVRVTITGTGEFAMKKTKENIEFIRWNKFYID